MAQLTAIVLTAVTVLAGLAVTAHAEDAASPPNKVIRDVTPPGVLRVFRTETAPPKTRRSTSITIEQALVKPDGLIEGGGLALRLYGVAFPPVKQLCVDAQGTRWPCGRRAYVSLYNKIHDDRVDCAPKGNDKAGDDHAPTLADCFVGDLNLAEWLLRQGLVTRTADADDQTLAAAETAAKQAKLGLWGEVK